MARTPLGLLVSVAWLSAGCGGAAAEGPATMTPNADGSVTVPMRALERKLETGVRDPELPGHIRQELMDASVTSARVVVDLCLDAAGHPDKVVLRESSRHELADQFALDTVRSWRFSPTQGPDGKPVRVCTLATIRWNLPFPVERRQSSPFPT